MARAVLVGLPGVGKSTVAAALAEALACAWLDTDQLFAARYGTSVAQVLREDGEARFREMERVALEQALSSEAIVATGGGIVTTPEARDLLRGECTIWLDATDDVLVTRVVGGDRPLLGDDAATALVRLRAQRGPWYADVARHVVMANGSVDETVATLLGLLEEQ
jgi:shikimate kinase